MQDSAAIPTLAPALNPAMLPARQDGRAQRQLDFATIMARTPYRAAPGTDPDHARAAQVRESAEDLVSSALVQPLLAQLRGTSMAAEPFKPTDGELRFRALLDAQVAKSIVRASRFPLVEQMADRITAASERRAPDGAEGRGGQRQPVAAAAHAKAIPLRELDQFLPLPSLRQPFVSIGASDRPTESLRAFPLTRPAAISLTQH